MTGLSSRMSPRSRPLSRGGDEFAASSRFAATRRDEIAQRAESRSTAVADDSIDRSLRAVERAVENLAILQENCSRYKELAIELRKALDDEKEHAKVFAQQLADADRARRADRERADRAERRLEQAAQTIRDMEREMTAMRTRADRLVHTVDRLTAGDRSRGPREIADDLADLLAA